MNEARSDSSPTNRRSSVGNLARNDATPRIPPPWPGTIRCRSTTNVLRPFDCRSDRDGEVGIRGPSERQVQSAAGALSRRLQNASTNWVDFRGSPRKSVHSRAARSAVTNALTTEVARHQRLENPLISNFNSRRLHRLRFAKTVFAGSRLGFDRHPSGAVLGTTPAALSSTSSSTHPLRSGLEVCLFSLRRPPYFSRLRSPGVA